MATEAIDPFRLPTNVRPAHYDLSIQTDLEKLTFEGFVKIKLDVKERTKFILLNSVGLNLKDATISSENFGVQSLKPVLEPDTKRVKFDLPESLVANSAAELTIGFGAELSDSCSAYYRSAWEQNGETKYYTLTQFESTEARRALPCWDEPSIKATWDVTMVSRVDTVNLSNMPVKSEEPLDATKASHAEIQQKIVALGSSTGKWKVTKFERTPLMSSYLLAYANGPFEYLETKVKMPLSGRDILLRIYGTLDVIHQGQFALDVKAKVLPLYEKMFEVEFPLPKLDTLVAADYEAGAMENWGLITGRTNAYLVDPAKMSLSAKERIVETQSHEVSHMWFGNITTPAWWDTLYLKEGFATLMGEVIIPNLVFPEMKPNSAFINNHLQPAMALDAKLSSHPIEVPCPDPDDIGQIFDGLSYSKAGSVLRMLANYVGEDLFIKGVSIYLKKHLYSNAETKDLWDGISQATGLDISQIMDNWMLKMGYPILTVKEVEGGILVRQDRFLETGLAEGEDNTTIWNVPLFIKSGNEGQAGASSIETRVILKEREAFFKVDTSKPFKLNGGTVGFYKVLYSPERLEKIANEAVKEISCFSLDDRLGLVLDAMTLAKAGLAKLSSALTLVDALKNEKEYLVWDGIALNLGSLASVWWEHPEIREKLDTFKQSLLAPIAMRIGFDYAEDEHPDIWLLRSLAIRSAAEAKDKWVVEELRRRFKHYMDTGDSSLIHPDIEVPTYRCAVQYGGVEEYEFVRNIHLQPKTPGAGMAARYALCGADKRELLDQTFDTMMNHTRLQDFRQFVSGLSGNAKTRREMADYFRENYDKIYKMFEKNYMFQHLVPTVFGVLSSERDLKETEEFFKDKDTSRYRMTLKQALDNIRSRAKFIEHSTEDVRTWLEGRVLEKAREKL